MSKKSFFALLTSFFIAFAVTLFSSTSEALDSATGSYSQSCRNCSDDTTAKLLRSCQCKNKQGTYVTNAALAYGLCEGEIWNDNGTLKCTPKGSFKNSCGPYTWNATNLTASCRTSAGKVTGSRLNWTDCTGDIANCNGNLRCLCDGNCPSGSYKNSCSCCGLSSSSSVLNCRCKNISGSWGDTALNISNCTQEIANCNGTLRCLCGTNCPQGSYSNSCWCCYISGSNLSCYCKNKKGKSVSTSLSSYTSCQNNTIWNDNGSLKCTK